MDKHDLKSIDLLFDSDLYLEGEKLYNEGGVIEINKTGSAIYSVFISDGEIIEVEMKNPITKSQKASCECDIFKTEKACKHLVAAYLALKKVKSKTIDKKTSKPKTLNINALMEMISHDEIRAFVKNYAVSDKKFSTMLKVNFARKLELENNYDKYRNILDSVLRPITTAERTVSVNEIKMLISVVKDLIEQAKDAFVLNQYVEVMDICSACLLKCSYTYTHFGHKASDLKQLLIELHRLLFDLYNAPSAIALKNSLTEFFKDSLNLSYYQLISPKYNALDFLIFNEILSSEEAKAVINKRINENPQGLELTILYSMRYRLLTDDNFEKALEIDSKHARYIEAIIEDVIACGDNLTALKLLNHFVAVDKKNTRLSLKYAQVKYTIDGKKSLKDIAVIFIDSKNLDIIDLIKSEDEDNYDTLIKYISKNTKFDVLRDSIYYPYYLAKIEAWDDLLSYLTSIKDISLLRQFDKHLYAHRKLLTTILYEDSLENYLNTHIGEMSIQYLNELYYHLKSFNANGIVSKISRMLKEKFSHRSGIENTMFNF
jgi:DNA-binding transcriptional regulator YiaG